MKLLRATLALSVLAGTAAAQDARPAPFPDKAQAILVDGSGVGGGTDAFPADVNNMETCLTSNANRWVFGASNVQKLLYAGAGAGKSSWANVQTAMTTAATNMWSKPAREQNLVYYHSSHGLPGDDGSTASTLGSQLCF